LIVAGALHECVKYTRKNEPILWASRYVVEDRSEECANLEARINHFYIIHFGTYLVRKVFVAFCVVKTMSDNSEDGAIEAILSSMGVDKPYDPLVVSALKECAHSFAGDLLCDAKDYASHRGKAEIEVSDIKLAQKLTNSMNVGIGPLDKQISETKEIINKIPLSRLVCQDTYGARYPHERVYTKPSITSPGGGAGEVADAGGELVPDPATGLLQRRYTLVPGSTAYGHTATGGGGVGGGSRQRAGSLTKANAQPAVPTVFESVSMAPPENKRAPMDVSEM
jgi:histone H3/H4